jgi:hypothetical protein
MNWVATPPTAGALNKLGPLPEIIKQPSGQLMVVSQTMTLSVQAQGQGAPDLSMALQRGELRGATGATLVLTNAQISHSGEYEVVVMDSNGAATSKAAAVMVGEDHDVDGMEDNWEFAYGFNPYDPTDAVQDPTWTAYQISPSTSRARIPSTRPATCTLSRFLPTASEAVVSFYAVANHSYSVQYTDQMSPPLWLNLGDVDPRSTNFIATIVDSLGAGNAVLPAGYAGPALSDCVAMRAPSARSSPLRQRLCSSLLEFPTDVAGVTVREI